MTAENKQPPKRNAQMDSINFTMARLHRKIETLAAEINLNIEGWKVFSLAHQTAGALDQISKMLDELTHELSSR